MALNRSYAPICGKIGDAWRLTLCAHLVTLTWDKAINTLADRKSCAVSHNIPVNQSLVDIEERSIYAVLYTKHEANA